MFLQVINKNNLCQLTLLLREMGALADVFETSDQMELQIAQLQDTVVYLEKEGVEAEEM